MSRLTNFFMTNGIPNGFVKIGKSIDATGFFNEVGAGLRNAWYNFTGQTEKTSAYKAMLQREDTAYQRAAEDMEKAGLSKYGGVSQASSTSPQPSSDPLTKSIQLASAILDLKAKQAGVRKTEAETDNVAANTAYTEKTISNYDQKIMADINQSLMQTSYLAAQKSLLEDQSPYIVEKTIAETLHLCKQADLYLSQKKYYDKQSGILDIDRSIRQKDLEKYEYRFIMEKEKHAESIAKSVSDRNHLSKQDELILKDLAYKQLQIDTLQYDWNFSKEHGLRLNDTVSRFMGINLDSTGQMASDLTRAIPPSLVKLFLPTHVQQAYENVGIL